MLQSLHSKEFGNVTFFNGTLHIFCNTYTSNQISTRKVLYLYIMPTLYPRYMTINNAFYQLFTTSFKRDYYHISHIGKLYYL